MKRHRISEHKNQRTGELCNGKMSPEVKGDSVVIFSEITRIKMIIREVPLDSKKTVRGVLKRSKTGNRLRFR